MSLQATRALVVTAQSRERIDEFYRVATKTTLAVSEPEQSAERGHWTIALTPHPKLTGEAASKADKDREYLIAWLKSQRLEDGSEAFAWAFIEYDAPGLTLRIPDFTGKENPTTLRIAFDQIGRRTGRLTVGAEEMEREDLDALIDAVIRGTGADPRRDAVRVARALRAGLAACDSAWMREPLFESPTADDIERAMIDGAGEGVDE